MARTDLRCCAALLFGGFLTGCSGGGGSSVVASNTATTGPAAPPPTSGIAVNLQPAKTTVSYQAAAATATGAGKGMNNIAFSAVGQGATVILTTDASGNLSGVQIRAAGISENVSSGGGAGSSGASLTSPRTLDFTFQLSDTLLFNNEYSYTISQVAAGQGLTSGGYGMWAATGAAYPGSAGVFAFGNLTPPTSVPATGSATFNGFTIGAGGAVNGSGADGRDIYFLKGNAQIIANFSTQSVTTNLTNFTAGSYSTSVPISVPNLTGTSTISGNGYAGPISGGGLAGTINGNFYGSAAQETTGVWQASGGGNAWIGSFGAK